MDKCPPSCGAKESRDPSSLARDNESFVMITLAFGESEAARSFERAAPSLPCLALDKWALFALMGRHRPLYLFLYGRHIKTGALLHRRKLDKGLRLLTYFLLHERKTPELECKPVVVGDRPVVLTVVHSRPLVGVQSQVDEDWPIDFYGSPQPAVGLIGEAVFEIVDSHRT